MKVTRTIQACQNTELHKVCKIAGFIRADLWRRYGALGTINVSSNEIRKQTLALYKDLLIDGTIRSETVKDIVNDIYLYKAAAKVKVKKAISIRTKDDSEERKRLFTLLKKDDYLKDNFLHRQMRKHFKHGVSKTDNQFIVRSDRFITEIVDGKLNVIIKVAKKFGDDIRLVTTTNGKNVSLDKCNLRVIVKDGFVEIHYATEKGEGRPIGSRTIGIDKGYTEVFTDSDGKHYGQSFGSVMTEYSDKASKTGKGRNKLFALEKKHRKNGKIKKADNIKNHNLGRKKIDSRKEKAQKQLRTIAFKSAHSLVDKAETVVSEDLTSPIASKKPWKKFNRRMSSWAKGVIAESLDSVCTQRGANHELVSACYTSQMDSMTGLLEGKRVGDKFYRVNGEVIQSDHNAAKNVLARLYDDEIGRFMPFKNVKQILLGRSPAQLSVNRLELGLKSRQPSADKSLIVNFG